MSRQFELALPSLSFPLSSFIPFQQTVFQLCFLVQTISSPRWTRARPRLSGGLSLPRQQSSPESLVEVSAGFLSLSSSSVILITALSLWGPRPGHQRQGQTHPLRFHQGLPDPFISSFALGFLPRYPVLGFKGPAMAHSPTPQLGDLA